MDQIVHQQLKAYLENHHILHQVQHGFCSKRSCCSASLELSNWLSAAKNDRLFSILGALDYTRAFVTIDHDILIRKFMSYFGKSTVAWFASYLYKRQHYVLFNGVCWELLPASNGVPLGSVMGPTLFLLYIAEMFNLLPNNSAIACVDDVTLSASCVTVEVARSAMQDLLNVISCWSIQNRLCLNNGKCTIVCIAPTKQKAQKTAPSCGINRCVINSLSSVKILDIIFTSDLCWLEHARAVCSKVTNKLGVIQRVGATLNKRTHL